LNASAVRIWGFHLNDLLFPQVRDARFCPCVDVFFLLIFVLVFITLFETMIPKKGFNMPTSVLPRRLKGKQWGRRFERATQAHPGSGDGL